MGEKQDELEMLQEEYVTETAQLKELEEKLGVSSMAELASFSRVNGPGMGMDATEHKSITLTEHAHPHLLHQQIKCMLLMALQLGLHFPVSLISCTSCRFCL